MFPLTLTAFEYQASVISAFPRTAESCALLAQSKFPAVECNVLSHDVVVETDLCEDVVTMVTDFLFLGQTEFHFVHLIFLRLYISQEMSRKSMLG